MNRPLALLITALTLAVTGPLRAQQANSEVKPQAPIVFIGGSGPAPHFEFVVDALSAALAEAKITVKTGEGSTRGVCLEKTNAVGAKTLLYVVAAVSERNAHDSNVTLQCIGADGTKLWEEEQQGPFLSSSAKSTVKGITEKIVKKLQAHFGKPGLEVPKP